MGNFPGESPSGHVSGLWALAMAMKSGSLLSWFSPSSVSGNCAVEVEIVLLMSQIMKCAVRLK